MKNIERLYYFLLLLSIQFAYFFIRILIFLSPFIKKNNPQKDLILFPYAQKGSTGYFQRFEIYFTFLKRDNIIFDAQDVFDDEYILSEIDKGIKTRYYLYSRIVWIRIFQVLKARNYKAAFYQRHLIPFLPDRKKALLEKLLFKLNPHVTVDYWDSDWVRSPQLINTLTRNYVHQISCINNFIEDHFNSVSTKKILFPMGIKLKNYIQKQNYSIDEQEIKLFYTGSLGNVRDFLKITKDALLDLSERYSTKLIIVSRGEYYVDGLEIEYHKFSVDTFFSIMSSCDLGLYAMEDHEIGRGKMAMKTLDYWASALPSVVSPVGLSPYANNGEDCLFSIDSDNFYSNIEKLILSSELRKEIGLKGYETAQKYHNIENNYEVFKQIIKTNG